MLEGDTEVITNAQVTALQGENHVESVEITTNDGEVLTRPAQTVVAALGFIADLSAMEEWGLEFEKRHIRVDMAMRTNVPRIFAAGDITEYDGKVRLIAVGFGEVATAVNNSAVIVNDATGTRLIISSSKSGSDSAFRLSTEGASGISDLAFDPDQETNAMTLTQTASDAQATITPS